MPEKIELVLFCAEEHMLEVSNKTLAEMVNPHVKVSIAYIGRLYVDWEKKVAHYINGNAAKKLLDEGKTKVTYKPGVDWRHWVEEQKLKINTADIGHKLSKKGDE